MILQNETVICIKTNEETWDQFNNNYYIKELPKRILLPLLEEGLLGYRFDTNVYPSYRKSEYYKDISNWATHIMTLSRFLQEYNSEWLLVVESQIDLGFITTNPKKGITLLGPGASVYLVDRSTAKKIIENSNIYYTSFSTLLYDMKKIDLIEIYENRHFKEIKDNKYYKYLPLILIAILLLFILNPVYRFIAKQFISFTKMAGSKESVADG